MAFCLGFQDFFYSFNDLNNPLAQPAKLKTKPALSPVGLIFLLCEKCSY